MRQVLPFASVSDLTRSAWLELVEHTPGCSVDLHPSVVALDAAAGPPPLVYTDFRGSQLETVAVLVPKVLRTLHHPSLEWIGCLQGYRLAGNQLAGRADHAATEQFLDTVSRSLGKDLAECIYFEDIDVDGPIWNAIIERSGDTCMQITYPRASQPHWRIDFPDPPADYWNSVSSKSRYKARRRLRGLAHEVKRYTAPEEVDRFLIDAERISEKSWQGKRLGLRMRLDETLHSRFAVLARLGAFRSYVLYHEDRPVAFVYGWQWSGRFEYEEIGYDGELARYAPGRILLYRILEDLLSHRCPEVLDFGCGDAEYKRTFGNREGASGPVVVAANTLKAQLWAGLQYARGAVDQGMRELLHRTGLYEQARKRYRQAVASR